VDVAPRNWVSCLLLVDAEETFVQSTDMGINIIVTMITGLKIHEN
jgi:hypothetical protein